MYFNIVTVQSQKYKKNYSLIIKIILYIFIIITALLIPFSDKEPTDMLTYNGETSFDGNSAYELDKELSYKFQRRVVGSENDYKISNWTAKKFNSYGLNVTWQNFTTKNFDGKEVHAMNVIGVVKGKSQKSIVVMAHRDIVVTTAQGANDNGAGTAVMLELAKIFAPLNNEYTLVFVSVDAEETGLHGSRYFIKNYDKIDDVFVAVVIDMCSWKNATAIELYGSSTLVGEFSDAWPITLAFNVGNKNGFNVHFSQRTQFINRLTLMKGTTDSTSFVEAEIPAIGIGDSDLSEKKNQYPWVHSWRDTINETSPERFGYVGNFTEKYIKSMMMIESIEDQGTTYFFTDNGYIPPYIFYLHFSSYFLIIGFTVFESIRKTKKVTKEKKVYTFLHSLFILFIPLFSIISIYFISQIEGFETAIGDVNWKTYIILSVEIEVLSMIYIFYGNRIIKKFTNKILKIDAKEIKESKEVVFAFISFLILIFFIITIFKNGFITTLFFAVSFLVFLQTKQRKNKITKLLNILCLFLALMIPLFILSKILSTFEFNDFSHYLPSIISSAYGSSSIILFSLFIAIITLNIKLIVSKN